MLSSSKLRKNEIVYHYDSPFGNSNSAPRKVRLTPNQLRLGFCVVVTFLIGIALLVANTPNESTASRMRSKCFLPGYLPHNTDLRTNPTTRREAYATLVSSDKPSGVNGLSYVDAAIVLIHGLRKSGTQREILVLATDNLSKESLTRLKSQNATLILLQNIEPPTKPDERIERMRFSFSKLWAWTLEDYTKIVYLDADHLVLRNIDDLFKYPELSATPELEVVKPGLVGTLRNWLNYKDPLEVLHERPRAVQVFQCGMFVLEPHKARYEEMLKEKERVSDYPKFGVDTGFMNCYFQDAWQPLPFGYNAQYFCNSSPSSSKCSAFKSLWQASPHNVRTVHDKFFLYSREHSEVNKLWFQQLAEASS